MVEAETRSDLRNRDAVRPFQQFFPCRGQAEPPPVRERRNSQKRTKMLVQRPLTDAAMGNEVGHRNLAAHAVPHVLHGSLEVVRERLAVHRPFGIEMV